MLIFMVRHAESTWNRLRKVQGQKDPHLSAYGRRESALLSKRFKGLSFDFAYSSPLKRAYETAQIILGKRAKIMCEAGLREVGLGTWEGKTIAQIRKKYGEAFDRWAVRPSRIHVPGGEDFKAFVARVKRTMGTIEKRHPGSNVLVVCHGGVISTYITLVLNLPPDDVWCFTVKNASLTIIDVEPEARKLVTFNNVAHLMSLEDISKGRIAHVD